MEQSELTSQYEVYISTHTGVHPTTYTVKVIAQSLAELLARSDEAVRALDARYPRPVAKTNLVRFDIKP